MTKLWAPESYYTDPRVEEVVGGCGPGGLGDWFVPDTIYGISIRESCRRHDWCYFVGRTQADKEQADRGFLNNMLRQIDDCDFLRCLNVLRRRRARLYYEAVRIFGGPAFWNEKNLESEFREAA